MINKENSFWLTIGTDKYLRFSKNSITSVKATVENKITYLHILDYVRWYYFQFSLTIHDTDQS